MGCGMNSEKVVMLGMGFFLLFSAFNSIQNLATQMFRQLQFNSLGNYSMGALYFVFAFFSFVAPSVAARFGSRKCLIIGIKLMESRIILVRPLIAVFLFPVVCTYTGSQCGVCSATFIWIITLLFSIILGIGASIIWVGQGTYLKENAIEGNENFYQSLFWGIYMMSQLVGNILGGLLQQEASLQIAFFGILSGLAIISLFVFICLPKPISKHDYLDKIGRYEEIYSTLKDPDDIKFSTEVKERTKASIKLLFTKRTLPLIVYMLYTGYSVSYYSGIFTISIQQKIDGERLYVNSMTLYVMTCLGAAEIIGGYLEAKAAKLAKSIVGGLVEALVLCIISTIFIYLIFFLIDDFGWYWFIAGFLLGLADAAANTFILSILASHFEGQTAEAFGMYGFLKSIAPFLGFIIPAEFSEYNQIYFVLAYLVLGALGFCFALFFDFSDVSSVSSSSRSSKKSDRFPEFSD